MKYYLCSILLILSSVSFANPLITLQRDWNFLYEKDDVRVFSQKAPHEKLLAFAGEYTLDATLAQVLYTIRGTENATKWMPNLEKRELLEMDESGLQGVTYNIFSLNFMLQKREVIASSMIAQEGRWLALKSASTTHKDKLESEDFVRANMEFTHLYFKPALHDRKKTQVILFSRIDPKGSIPTFIVNTLRKSFPVKYLKALESFASNVEVKNQYPSIDKLIESYMLRPR